MCSHLYLNPRTDTVKLHFIGYSSCLLFLKKKTPPLHAPSNALTHTTQSEKTNKQMTKHRYKIKQNKTRKNKTHRSTPHKKLRKKKKTTYQKKIQLKFYSYTFIVWITSPVVVGQGFCTDTAPHSAEPVYLFIPYRLKCGWNNPRSVSRQWQPLLHCNKMSLAHVLNNVLQWREVVYGSVLFYICPLLRLEQSSTYHLGFRGTLLAFADCDIWHHPPSDL